MKKITVLFISTFSLLMIFSACQSSKNNVTASDTYNDAPDTEINAEEQQTETASNKPVTPKKKNALEDFFTYGNRDAANSPSMP